MNSKALNRSNPNRAAKQKWAEEKRAAPHCWCLEMLSGSQFPLPLRSLALSSTVPLDHIRSLLPFPSHYLSNSPPSPFGGTWGLLSHTTPHSTLHSLSLSPSFFPMFSLFSHYPLLPAHPEDVSPFKNNQRFPSLPVVSYSSVLLSLILVSLPASSHLHRPVPKRSNACPLVTVARHFS